jgi:adenylate cyclase
MERRLSAIFAADIVGYSRLMEADEIDTINRQKRHRRELINPTFAEFHGRVVKEMGDGLLVEFQSVLDAVQCAIQIQLAMPDREANVPEDGRISYRIGINLGDIVIDGDDILGDGVNIAARLESMAPMSGICISDLVWQNLRGELGGDFSLHGDVNLKNISRKVRVWQWPADDNDKATATFAENVEPISRTERSIVVHPLKVYPEDADLRVYSLGFEDDIARALSKLGTLRIWAAESSPEADFAVKGTMRIVPPRIRCNLQLLDKRNGVTLWSEKFDGTIQEVFDFQDHVVEQVASACEIELTEGQQATKWRREAADPLAYELFLSGRSACIEYSRAGNARARSAFERAIERSPSFFSAIVNVARTHVEDATFGWATDAEKSLRNAQTLINQVLAIDPDHPVAHAERAHALLVAGDHQHARLEAELAIALDPDNADAHVIHAYCLSALDLPDRALLAARRAIRLNPGKPEFYFISLVDVMVVLERFEEALALCNQIISRRPDWLTAKVWRALALDGLSREEDARQQIKEVMDSSPSFSADRWRRFQYAPNRKFIAAMANQLVVLGLPQRICLGPHAVGENVSFGSSRAIAWRSKPSAVPP